VLFLEIEKEGTYRLSGSMPECLDRQISVKRDRVDITAEPYVYTTTTCTGAAEAMFLCGINAVRRPRDVER